MHAPLEFLAVLVQLPYSCLKSLLVVVQGTPRPPDVAKNLPRPGMHDRTLTLHR
jgi:hypothetical protein